jgi:hypothetical protein
MAHLFFVFLQSLPAPGILNKKAAPACKDGAACPGFSDLRQPGRHRHVALDP